MQLQRLVYVSTAAVNISEADLHELLIHARTSNAALGVTGLLIYNGQNFMQAIEGDGETISRLYERISKDQRHTGVIKLSQHDIAARAFEKWSMVGARIGGQEPYDAVNLPDHFSAAIPDDLQAAFAVFARLGF